MERENPAAARVGIEAIGEECLRAGALVTERERRFPRGQAKRHAGHVFGGLFFDADEGVTFGLRLDGADGFGIREKRVIGLAGFEGQFNYGDAARGGEVDLVLGLHEPTGRGEHLVDSLPGCFLRGHLS